MAERAGLFEEDIDLSQFTPNKPVKAEQPAAEDVRAVAENLLSFRAGNLRTLRNHVNRGVTAPDATSN